MPAQHSYIHHLATMFVIYAQQYHHDQTSDKELQQAIAALIGEYNTAQRELRTPVWEPSSDVTQYLRRTLAIKKLPPLVRSFAQTFFVSQAGIALHQYLLALESSGRLPATIKNYRSDIGQYLTLFPNHSLEKLLTKSEVIYFLKYEQSKGSSDSTIKRKLISLSQFTHWLHENDWIKLPLWTTTTPTAFTDLLKDAVSVTEPAEENVDQTVPEPISTTRQPVWNLPLKHIRIEDYLPKQISIVGSGINQKPSLLRRLTKEFKQQPLIGYFNLAMGILFLLGTGFLGYQQFFKETSTPFAYPNALTRPNRSLSFQGRLTDTSKTPITTATPMEFRLYDTGPGTGGSLLWDSGSCSIDPDQDGIFSTTLGDSCGTEITNDVFSENSSVWLEVEVNSETLEPRQPIKSVAYALNSETLQGYPASASAVENTVLVMRNDGKVVFGNANPILEATGDSFTITAKTMTLESASGSNGNIIINPDGTGQTLINSNTIIDGYLYAPGATLSATYAGGTPLTLKAGPSATANITEWQTAAGGVLGVIDESGNIGLGTTAPGAKLGFAAGTTAAGGIDFGVDTNLYRSGTDTLKTDDNLVVGTLGTGATNTVITHSSGTLQSRSIDARVWGSSLVDGSGTTNRVAYWTDGESIAADDDFFFDGTNVGIGTTSPGRKLDVAGDAEIANYLYFANGATDYLRFDGSNFILSNDLLPSADSSYNLGSATYAWANIYGDAIYQNGNAVCDASGNCGSTSLWSSALGALYPNNSTLDVLIGGTATASAKFAFLNVNSGTPTASIAGNLALAAPAGADPATKLKVYNGGSFGIQTSVGGDVGLIEKITFLNNGSVGIGTTVPATTLHTVGSTRVSRTSITSQFIDIYPDNSAGNINYSTGDGSQKPLLFNIEVTGGSANSSNYYAYSIDGSEKVRFGYDGNVGIGSTAPSQKLDVVGGIRLGAADAENVLNTSSAGGAPSGNLYWGDRTVCDSTGNCSAVDSNWSIAGGSIYPKNATLDMFIGGTATSSAKFAFLNVNSGTPTASIAGNLALAAPTGANPATKLKIYNGGSFGIQTSVGGDAGLTERLTILNNGNVGIGTTSPNYKLSIVNNTGGTALNISDQSSGALGITKTIITSNDTWGTLFTLQNTDTGGQTHGFMSYGSTNPYAAAGTFAIAVGGSDKFAITSGGNIGIGTNYPSALLDIAGSATSSGTLTFRGTTDPKIDILNGENLGIRTSVGGDAGLTERLTILNNGNVGIGSTSPAQLLDVAGAGLINSLTLDGNTGTALSISGTSFGTDLSLQNGETVDNDTDNTVNIGFGAANGIFKLTSATEAFLTSSAALNIDSATTNALNIGTGANAKTITLGNATTTTGLALNSGTGDITLTSTDQVKLNSSKAAGGTTTEALSLKSTADLGVADELLQIGDSAGDFLTVMGNGNVGIGTTNPQTTLDILGSSYFRINSGSNPASPATGAGFELAFDTDGKAGASAGGSGGTLMQSYSRDATAWRDIWIRGGEISIDSNGTEVMRIVSGNVGIGSTAPSQALDVVGGIRLGTAGAGNVLNTTAGSAPTGNLYWGNRTVCDSTGNCGGGGQWTAGAGILYPNNNTLDVFIGGTATSSAKFAFLNVNSGSPTASIGGSLSLVAPTGSTPATELNIYNGGTFTIQNSVGGDAGLTDSFAVSPTQITSYLPHQFSAAGDVSMAYDLIFTNQTSAGIESNGPFSITAGESWENNNLTLSTYGSGNLIANLGDTGKFQITSADPSIILDTKTSTDTDFWLGVQEDAGGDDDDIFSIGDGTTIGTNSFLSINTAGNVGIGTTAPSYKLQTTGDIKLTDGTNRLILAGNTTNPTGVAGAMFYDSDDNKFKCYTTTWVDCDTTGSGTLPSGTEGQMLYNDAGNWTAFSSLFWDDGNSYFGIGTTTPTAKLDIVGSASSSGTLAFRGTTDPKIDILNGENFGIRTSVGGDVGLTERLTVLNNGNVGIGTTAPSQLLDVAGEIELANYLYFANGSTEYLRWDGSNFLVSDDLLPNANDTLDLGSDTARWKDIYLGGETIHLGASTTDEGTISYTSGNVLSFSTDSTTNGDIAFFTDDLYLDKSSGNVGIGTTAPIGHLHVGAGGLETTDEPKIIVSELIDNSLSSNPHSFVDVSRVNRTGDIAMASFDASATFLGTYDYLHYAAHKSRMFFQGSGTMDRYYGYFSDLNMTDSTGQVTDAYRYYGQDATDVTGNGTIVNNYGVYIEPLTKGTTSNFAIYTGGTTNSYFGGNIGIGTTVPSEKLNVVGNGLITAGTLVDQKSALRVTATLPAGTVSTYNSVVNVQATSQNSTNNAYPFNLDLLAGATDARVYAAARFGNAVAGTGAGTTLWSGAANSGLIAIASGNTTGFNFGGRFTASNGNQSIGLEGSSITTKNSGTNIGVIGYGLNAGTSPIQIGGYFGLHSTPPTFTSAGLIADNGSTTSPIFLARDNGSSVFAIDDGGNVGIGTTAPSALLQLGTAGTSLGTFRLTGNTSGYTQIQPNATAGDWTLTLPLNDGDNGQVLTTDGSGGTSWTTVSGGSGANTALSNLASVAINTNLISDTADTDDLGSATFEWNSLYLADGSGLTAGGGLFFGNDQDLLLTYDETTSDALELSDGTNTFLSIKDQGTAADIAFNTDDLFIASAGNVGIGSTAPANSLDVVGDIGIRSGNELRLYTTGDSNYNQIYSSTANLYMMGGNGEVVTQAASNIDFQTYTTGTFNSKMVLTNAGNLGIGSSSPTQKLTVSGSATVSGTLALGPMVQVDAGTCNAAAKGKQYFDGSTNIQYVCDGTAWTQMSVAFTSSDGSGVTSSGSGLEFGTNGFGLIQGCANTEVLKWNEASSIWECKPSTYSKFVSTAVTNIVNSTGNTASVASTNVDVDAVIGAASSATQALVQLRITVTNTTGANWSGHVMPTGDAVATNNGVVWAGELDGAAVGYGMAIVALDANKVFSWGLTEITGTSTTTLEINVVGYWTPVTTGADLAENYYGDASIKAGSLVSLDPSLEGGVVKSEADKASHLIGVVSSQPGMVLDAFNDTNNSMTVIDKKYLGRVPIAVGLTGRVPVQVTTENGPINPGDPITISSIAGVGMKATQSGTIIGRSLESYSNSDPTAIGQVVVFLNLGYYEPMMSLNESGELILVQDEDESYQIVNQATLQQSSFAKQVGTFVKTISAYLEAGAIKTKELVVSSQAQIADLSVTNLNIGGQNLRDYIVSVIQDTQTNPVITQASPTPSPPDTATGSAWLAEIFQRDQATGQPVVENLSVIDTVRSASISAETITTDELKVAGQTQLGSLLVERSASVAGVFTTNELEANSARIDALEAGVAQLQNVKATTAEFANATVSGTLYAQTIADLDRQIAELLEQPNMLDVITGALPSPQTDYSDLYQAIGNITTTASQAAQLDQSIADLNLADNDVVLTASAAFIESYFKVNGIAYVSDSLGVGNSLHVGTGVELTDTYLSFGIDTPDDPGFFSIQPSGKGLLAVMGDLLILDGTGEVRVNGNLTVAGNLSVEGSLLANEIAPINAGGTVKLNLGQSGLGPNATASGQPATSSARFEVLGDTGSPVATVSAQGKASFSGLSLDRDILERPQVAGAATSSSQLTQEATQTTGKAILPAGNTELIIKNPNVHADSLIYLTPQGSTQNQVIYVKSTTAPADEATAQPDAERSFTVGLDGPAVQDISFTWWIVN